MKTNDGKPYIEIKKARIARAGKQFYTAAEMSARSANFKDSGKVLYTEYRPPEVVLKHIGKFNYVPFVNDHAPVDVTPDNWKQYTIGMVGGNAGVEIVDNEVWITNDVIFYDRTAYDNYKSGKVELSASYDARFALVENTENAEYDSVLIDIPAVNHVALCDRARAGHNARILDSVNIVNKTIGGHEMSVKAKGGFLSFLGIGKSKDEGFKFSEILMSSIAKVKTLDAAGIEKEVGDVLSYVATLGDSEAKELLVGAVSDCFKSAEAVLAKKDDVSKRLDELYGKCADADAGAVKRILGDGDGKDGKDDKDKDAKDGKDKDDKGGEKGKIEDAQPQNIDAVISKAVDAAVSKINDSIEDKVSAAVNKALGLTGAKDGKDTGDKRTDDSAGGTGRAAEDASYLVRDVFGTR